MRSLTKRIWAPLLAGVLCFGAAQAQDQTSPAKPVPPPGPQAAEPSQDKDSKQSGSKGQGSGQEPVSPALTAGNVVTGGFAPRAGDISDTSAQIRFGVRVGELLDTNYQILLAPNGLDSITFVSGHLDMHRPGPNSDFLVRYVGGGNLDVKNPQFNTTYHELEASETIQFQRWTLKLDDLFSYLPESAFGFNGGGPGGTTLLDLLLVDPSVTPGQSIFTPQSNRMSNTVVAQAQIMKSERTTYTVTGSYGFLHYMTPGFLNPSNFSFGAGYNYRLKEQDTLGISYLFNAYRFNPALASINDSTILVTYGHHISGRLVLQGGIGPEVNTFTPVGASSGSTRVAWSANAGLSYQLPNRTTLSGSYTRLISGGGGILLASVANNVQFGASRQLGERWNVNGTFGWEASKSLPQASVIVNSYNGIYAGAGITRMLGERTSLYINYNFLHQTTNVVCVGPICAGPIVRHQIFIGVNFDFRPIGIR